MSEGNLYLCESRTTEDGVRVWLKRRPKIFADGETLDEALQELSGVVCLSLGDGEAVFELEPPPGSPTLFEYVALSGNSGWRPPRDFSLRDFAALYEGGVCDTCCQGIGLRSKVPLPVGLLGKADLLISGLRMPSVILASERFRALLRPAERAQIKWMPIESRAKSRRTFFEIAAKQSIKTVADKQKRVHGWRCPECAAQCFSVDYEHVYVAQPDLRAREPDLLLIDSSHHLWPVISYARWAKIRGKPGARNLVTQKLVALPRSRVRRRPDLRILTAAESRAIHSEFYSTLGRASPARLLD